MRVIYWARLGLARAALTDGLRAVPGCDLVVVEKVDELLAALPQAEALVLYDAPQPDARRVVAAIAANAANAANAASEGGRLRWMHFVSAGREGFEAAGLPPGPAITYAAGAVAPTVAEHAMALLLALARRVPEMVAQAAEHRWDRGLAVRALSLEGRTMAIVGMGHIGVGVARRAKAFGMTTIGLSRRTAADPSLDESLPLGELRAALARADVVVIAIALVAETRHLIGRAELAACRPGALLINVARGGIVDQAALVQALHSGQIGGAGLDVATPEPLPADDPLWAAPNVLIAPHFGGSGSAASLARLADGAVANLRRLLAGQDLQHQVQAGLH